MRLVGALVHNDFMQSETHYQSFIRQYLQALENGAIGDELARFFTPNAIQIEYPNKLNPRGANSDFATILKRAEAGRGVIRTQHFEIVSIIEQGDHVAVEAHWTGTLAISLGKLVPGDTMSAHFAMFFEMKEGRIAKQHNYDCFVDNFGT